MEYENKYASKGVAGTALGLGAGALGVELLRGGLGGLLGGWNNSVCGEGAYINRYEAAQNARIAELESEVKLRDASTYTQTQINNFRNYVDGKFDAINAHICQQNVYNATNTATLNCMSGQIAQLMSLTKLVVPNGSICPGWGDVTVSVTPAAGA
jgi:hypothetical protein